MQISEQLIKSCIAQERQAQQQLYQLLLPYLRAVADRYLRDVSYLRDVLQEGFVKIFKHLEKHDPSKAPLHHWAAKIVIHTAINYNDRVALPNSLDIQDYKNELQVTPAMVQHLTDEFLLSILKQMPDGYFEVFNLFVIDGYSHEEIAQMLGIAETLSRQRLTRAKAWLKNRFEHQPDLLNELHTIPFILN